MREWEQASVREWEQAPEGVDYTHRHGLVGGFIDGVVEGFIVKA